MQDVANTPGFALTRFLCGKTRAWGIVEDRFGRIQRKFSLEMHGHWQGDVFHLDESFRFDDGEEDSRTWLVTPGKNGRFTATCGDCVGHAEGQASGDTISMSYRFRIMVGGRAFVVGFDDRIFRMDENLAINRATMRKWGIKVGELSAVFMRDRQACAQTSAAA